MGKPFFMAFYFAYHQQTYRYVNSKILSSFANNNHARLLSILLLSL